MKFNQTPVPQWQVQNQQFDLSFAKTQLQSSGMLHSNPSMYHRKMEQINNLQQIPCQYP